MYLRKPGPIYIVSDGSICQVQSNYLHLNWQFTQFKKDPNKLCIARSVCREQSKVEFAVLGPMFQKCFLTVTQAHS